MLPNAPTPTGVGHQQNEPPTDPGRFRVPFRPSGRRVPGSGRERHARRGAHVWTWTALLITVGVLVAVGSFELASPPGCAADTNASGQGLAAAPASLVVRVGSSTPVATPSSVAGGLVAGLNDHPVWLRCSQNVAFSLIRASHAKAVRIDVPWDVLQPDAKNTWDPLRVALIDDYVRRAAAAGIDVLMVVTNAPPWANGSTDPHVAPLNNTDYADYLAQLMARYPSVHEYEIWNEPNGGWAWTNPNPVKYAALLKVAYTRAKQVNPSVTILAPSLSGPDQASFLDRFYAAGAKNYFDAFSMHGYWWNLNGSTVLPYYNPANPDQSIFGAFTTRILPVMTTYRDAAKPVWWTETGIATQGSITTPTDEAAKIDQAFTAWRAGAIPTMTRLYWYSAIDTIGTGAEQNFGLVNLTGTSPTTPNPGDFAPKPAYTHYQTQAAKLG